MYIFAAWTIILSHIMEACLKTRIRSEAVGCMRGGYGRENRDQADSRQGFKLIGRCMAWSAG